MTGSVFWMNKEAYVAAGGKGFDCFSVPHLIWLAILFTGIFTFAFLYRRRETKKRDSLRKCVAVILILSEIGKQCVVALTGAEPSVHLPLHICSFAEYTILIDALWPENKFFKQLLCYAFLPSAFMALLFPTATAYHPISFYAVHHFLLHASIIAYIIARYSAGEIRINYKGVWTTFISILVLIIPIYFIDSAFNQNFIFLMAHDENPALKVIWGLSGGKGGIAYILGLGVLVIIVFHIVFCIFKLIEQRKKQTKNE